jgi:hypothetical protein
MRRLGLYGLPRTAQPQPPRMSSSFRSKKTPRSRGLLAEIGETFGERLVVRVRVFSQSTPRRKSRMSFSNHIGERESRKEASRREDLLRLSGRGLKGPETLFTDGCLRSL